jgi:hypothetical protein
LAPSLPSLNLPGFSSKSPVEHITQQSGASSNEMIDHQKPRQERAGRRD